MSASTANPEEPPPGVGLLTDRELRICSLIATGETNKAMAKKLGLSKRTVELCRQQIAKKLELRYTRDVVLWAAKHEEWLPKLYFRQPTASSSAK